MLETTQKQQLINDFCNFLESSSASELLLLNESKQVDLATVCTELIALKTEVKQESRQFKQALDRFKEVFKTLSLSNEVLTAELTQRRNEQQLMVEVLQQKMLKPILLELIELRDRLELGLIHYKGYRPNRLSLIFKREQTLIASMRDGQAMILRRIDQLLATNQVVALNTSKQPFDPQCMRAIAVERRADLPNGYVTTELRKGFVWKDLVLRIAEVKVNKIAEALEHE